MPIDWRSTKTKPRVILVDDEPMVVRGLRLHLRRRYDVQTAHSGPEALELLARSPDCAVVISDMRMPGMSGTELLSTIRQRSPNTWRILLTGQADLTQVAAAVNDGHIYACLLKPCRPDELVQAVDAAIHARQLALAEQDMMRETLSGAVDMVTELLAMANPLAFGKARRMKSLVGYVASALQLEDPWEFELAAMLSQVGCISVPARVLERSALSERLSTGETQLLNEHPAVARRLLQRIPRLEQIADMVGAQNDPFSTDALKRARMAVDRGTIGALLLQSTSAFDDLIQANQSAEQAVAQLEESAKNFDRDILEVLTRSNLGPLHRATEDAVRRAFATRALAHQQGTGSIRSWFDAEGAL